MLTLILILTLISISILMSISMLILLLTLILTCPPTASVRARGRTMEGDQQFETKIVVEATRGRAPTTATDLAAGATGDAPAGPERRRGTGARGADPPAAAVREEGVVRAAEAAGGRCGGRRGGTGTTPRRPPRVFSRPPEPHVAWGGVETLTSPKAILSGERGRRRGRRRRRGGRGCRGRDGYVLGGWTAGAPPAYRTLLPWTP